MIPVTYQNRRLGQRQLKQKPKTVLEMIRSKIIRTVNQLNLWIRVSKYNRTYFTYKRKANNEKQNYKCRSQITDL